MESKQQTALEWYIEQVDKLKEEYEYFDIDKLFWLKEDALQMEREQIVSAYSHGWHDGQDEIINRIAHIDKGGDEAGLKHFNDTYGTKPSR